MKLTILPFQLLLPGSSHHKISKALQTSVFFKLDNGMYCIQPYNTEKLELHVTWQIFIKVAQKKNKIQNHINLRSKSNVKSGH